MFGLPYKNSCHIKPVAHFPPIFFHKCYALHPPKTLHSPSFILASEPLQKCVSEPSPVTHSPHDRISVRTRQFLLWNCLPKTNSPSVSQWTHLSSLQLCVDSLFPSLASLSLSFWAFTTDWDLSQGTRLITWLSHDTCFTKAWGKPLFSKGPRHLMMLLPPLLGS